MRNKNQRIYLLLCIGLSCLICKSEAAIFEDIQNLFKRIDFSNNLNQALTDIKTEEKWESIDPALFKDVAKDKLEKIIREGVNLSQRTKDQITIQLAALDTDANSIVNKIRSSSITDSKLLTLAQNLPDPKLWNETFLNRMGSEPIRNLNNAFLLQIKDDKTITRLMNIVEPLLNSEVNENKKMKLEDLNNNLILKLAGDTKNWNISDAENFPIKKFTVPIIKKMPSNVVSLMNGTLGNEARTRNDCEFGREVLKKIFEGKLNMESNYVEFSKIYEEIDSELRKYLFFEDVNPEIRYLELIEGLMRNNIRSCMDRGYTTPKSRSLYRNNYDITSMTSNTLDSEGACAVGVMSLSAVNSALEFLNDGTRKQMDKCIVGADQNAKRVAMVLDHENKQSLDRIVSYSNQPTSTLEFAGRLGAVPENDAVNLLRNNDARFTNGKLEKLIAKVRGGSMSSLSPKIKGGVPLATIRSMSNNDLENIAKSMDGESLACIKASISVFDTKTTISVPSLIQYKHLLRCMSRINAKKVDLNTSPFEIARKLANERLSTSFAMELRDRITNRTIGKLDRGAAVGKLSVSDIDAMPLNTMASFGADLNNLKEMEREFLLTKMGKMEDLSEIPIRAQRTIVSLGLQTKKRGNGLMPGDLNLVGQSYMMISPDMVRNGDDATKMLFLDRVNNDIKEGKLNILCISSGMAGAISQSIQDVYGPGNKLDSMKGIECLMWAPSWNYIKAIPKEVLDEATCKLPMLTSSVMEMAVGNCLPANNNYYKEILRMEMNLDKMQKKSLIKVMETEVNMGTQRDAKKLELSPCEKGAILGVDTMSSTDRNIMTKDDVFNCMQYLGKMDMNRNNAKNLIIDNLLKMRNNDVTQLTELDLVKIGSGFKGFTSEQIGNLRQQYFQTNKELVRSVGELNLDNDQVKAVATMVKKNINTLSSLNQHDLFSLGNILCGFTTDELTQITYQSVQSAIPLFKRIKCPNNNFKSALKTLLGRLYGPEALDAAEMKDMGELAAELTPDYISKIKASAYNGLRPVAMKSMTSSQLNKMDVAGLGNINYETASVMSEGQINSLGGERRQAVLGARAMGGVEAGATASLLFVCLSIFVTNFL